MRSVPSATCTEQNKLVPTMLQKTIPSLVLFMAAGTLAAQQPAGPVNRVLTGSMHDIIEARSTALGESMAASARTPLAWNSNPATLAGVDGAGIAYSSRSLRYRTNADFNYTSASAFVGTGFGTFAAHYNRLDLGRSRATFDTTGTQEWVMYDHTVAFTYANDLLEPVSLGATLKLFTDRIVPNEGETGVYVDIGAVYSARGFLNGTLATDSVYAGISLQNLGGKYTYPSLQQTMEVGRTFRAGVAYDVGMLMEDERPRLRASLTAEYRRLLNPPEIWESTNYWGAGLEATLYDLVSLRGGLIILPVNSIYGRGGLPGFRYGAGLNLPFSRIGIQQPLSLAFDYAFIPLDPDHFFNDPGTSPLHALSVRLNYNGSIF